MIGLRVVVVGAWNEALVHLIVPEDLLSFGATSAAENSQDMVDIDLHHHHQPRKLKRQLLIHGEECLLDVELIRDLSEDIDPDLPEEMMPHGFVLIYDTSNRASFEQLRDIWDEIVRLKGTHEVPAVLFGVNDSNTETGTIVSLEEAKALAKELGCPCYDAGCLKAGFMELLKNIRIAEGGGISSTSRSQQQQQYTSSQPEECSIL